MYLKDRHSTSWGINWGVYSHQFLYDFTTCMSNPVKGIDKMFMGQFPYDPMDPD